MPRYEDHGENFYYIQEDHMFALQKQRSWSYNIIRPHGIIGFTPHCRLLPLVLVQCSALDYVYPPLLLAARSDLMTESSKRHV